MSYVVVDNPATEPVPYADAKDWCRLHGDEERDLLLRLITTARKWCESRVGRTLSEARTATLTASSWPDRALPLRLEQGPVLSVTSVSYVPAGGEEAIALPSDAWTLDRGRYVDHLRPWPACWPTTRGKPGDIEVVYQVGYAAAPEQAVQAMLMLVAHAYQHREAVGERMSHRVAIGVDALLDDFMEPVL